MDKTRFLETQKEAEEDEVRKLAKFIVNEKDNELKLRDGLEPRDVSVFMVSFPENGNIDIVYGLDLPSADKATMLTALLEGLIIDDKVPDMVGYSIRSTKAIEFILYLQERKVRWRITKTPDGDRADCTNREESGTILVLRDIRTRFRKWEAETNQALRDMMDGLSDEIPQLITRNKAFMTRVEQVFPELDKVVVLYAVVDFLRCWHSEETRAMLLDQCSMCRANGKCENHSKGCQTPAGLLN